MRLSVICHFSKWRIQMLTYLCIISPLNYGFFQKGRHQSCFNSQHPAQSSTKTEKQPTNEPRLKKLLCVFLGRPEFHTWLAVKWLQPQLLWCFLDSRWPITSTKMRASSQDTEGVFRIYQMHRFVNRVIKIDITIIFKNIVKQPTY